MNKRPGHVNVTTEVALCSFCGRPRTLRREEHQLGALVRTIVTCETCHRTLSSSIGVASEETPAAAEVNEVAEEPSPAAASAEMKAPPKKAAAKRPAAKATAAKTTKTTAAAKPAAKAKAPAKRAATKKR